MNNWDLHLNTATNQSTTNHRWSKLRTVNSRHGLSIANRAIEPRNHSGNTAHTILAFQPNLLHYKRRSRGTCATTATKGTEEHFMSRRRLFWHMTSPIMSVLVSNPRQLTLPFHTCRFPFVHAMHDREQLNCNGRQWTLRPSAGQGVVAIRGQWPG